MSTKQQTDISAYSQESKEQTGMENSQEQGSEVARLLRQIQAEYEAAQRGMSGVAYGTSRHEFITKKMENMGKLQEELQTLVGFETSIALVVDQLQSIPDEKSPSVQ